MRRCTASTQPAAIAKDVPRPLGLSNNKNAASELRLALTPQTFFRGRCKQDRSSLAERQLDKFVTRDAVNQARASAALRVLANCILGYSLRGCDHTPGHER